MSSDKPELPNSERSKFSELLQSIQKDAEAVGGKEDLDALKDRIDALELLVEDFGRARELQNALSQYVEDLQDETRDLRNYRFWITAFAWLMSVGLLGLVFFLIVAAPTWFGALDGSLQVPIVISFVTGAVVLKVILIKGVYRSRQERNSGDMIPEAVKIALDTFNSNR